MSNYRSLETRIKFDHGLPVGQSLVKFTLGDRSRLALVEIGSRGQVYYFIKPESCDMYSSWQRVKGDMTKSGEGAVKVWAIKDAEFMAKFEGEPLAIISVTTPAPSPDSKQPE